MWAASCSPHLEYTSNNFFLQKNCQRDQSERWMKEALFPYSDVKQMHMQRLHYLWQLHFIEPQLKVPFPWDHTGRGKNIRSYSKSSHLVHEFHWRITITKLTITSIQYVEVIKPHSTPSSHIKQPMCFVIFCLPGTTHISLSSSSPYPFINPL